MKMLIAVAAMLVSFNVSAGELRTLITLSNFDFLSASGVTIELKEDSFIYENGKKTRVFADDQVFGLSLSHMEQIPSNAQLPEYVADESCEIDGGSTVTIHGSRFPEGSLTIADTLSCGSDYRVIKGRKGTYARAIAKTLATYFQVKPSKR